METLVYNLNFDLEDARFHDKAKVEHAVVKFAFEYAMYRSEDTEPHIYEGKELSDVQKVINMINVLTEQNLGLMRGANLIIRIGELYKENYKTNNYSDGWYIKKCT